MSSPDSPDTTTPGALDGIRILDLSRVLAGPWCTQMLADLGAEVIKVERPGTGDDTRTWGPPYLKDAAGHDTSESAYYLSANRGKKSVVVDFTTTQGQGQIRRLAATADVVVENFTVGQLARYGLDYATLSQYRPGLIYCSITGFGQTGPWAARPGYDFIIQGLSGFMSVTGERDGAPGAGPQKAGVAICDLFTGVYACNAILAALYHRQRTGAGQHIDMALLDTMVSTMANVNLNYLTSGRVPERHGNAHANVVPYQTFECSDGQIIVAVGNDRQFERFCTAIGVPELARETRFATNPERVRNRAPLIPQLAARVKSATRAHWLAALESAEVPCGPVNSLAEVFDNEQIKARQMKVTLSHPLSGKLDVVASPMRMSVTPPRYDLPPPLLGEHNEEILAELLKPSQYDERR